MIVERDFLDHPKTVRLARALSDPAAPLLLIRIWGHCEGRRSDLLGTDPEDIAAICRFQGKADILIKALVSGRWLDESPEGWRAHGWADKNAPWLAKVQAGKDRAAQARRQKNGQLASGEAGQLASGEAGQLASGEAGQLASGEAGGRAGAVEWSGVEKSTTTSPALSRPAAWVREDSLDALSEAAALCLRLRGKKRTRLSQNAQQALAHHAADLPLSVGQVAMLTWFYGLPHDPEDIALRSRYDNADSLAENLFKALERAESYAEKSGGAPQKNGEKVPAPAPDPAGCWEWLAREYPSAVAPKSWASLPESIRSQFALSQKKNAA